MNVGEASRVTVNRSPTATQKRSPGVVLGMLTFVYVLNFLDRQLLSILAKPIQDSLHVSDGQLGLIGGFYFALFYCLIAIPVSWLADRTNRVAVLSAACGIWSAATIACGLSRSYSELVIARMTVGFGEAGGVPPSYALITDTFALGKRGMAFGIFNLGPPIGAALGIALGATIAALYDWRSAFIALGAVGIFAAALLVLIVPEPQRGATDGSVQSNVSHAPFWATVGAFFKNPVMCLAAFGGGATQFVTYGLGNFAVLFVIREKAMTMAEVAIWYALVIIVGMGGGMIASGKVIDRLATKRRSMYALAPAASLAIALPFCAGFIWAPSWQLALAFLTVAMFFNYFYLSCSVTLVQEESAPNQRVLMGALLLLVMNFIGLGLGPTWVGAASDWFADHGHPNPLQLSLYTLLPAYLFAIGLFLLLSKRLARGDAAS